MPRKTSISDSAKLPDSVNPKIKRTVRKRSTISKKRIHKASPTQKHIAHSPFTSNMYRLKLKWITMVKMCCAKLQLRNVLHSPYVAMAVAYIIWGLSSPLTKLALTEIGPASLILIRFTIATALLFPFILHHKHTLTTREQIYIGFSSVFAIFLHILFIYLALPLVPSVNAPILNALSPFLFIILARLIFHEKVTHRKYFGIGLGLIGVLCVTVIPVLTRPQGEILGVLTPITAAFTSFGSPLSSSLALLVGNGLLLLGVMFGVLGILCVKAIKHIPGVVISFWQFGLAACLALPFALTETNSLLNVHIGTYALVGIFYNAILSSVVAYSLYNAAIQKVQAADAGLLSYLAPLSALFLSVPLLHEYPNLWFIIGSVLVLAGVWVAEHKIEHHTHT